MSEESTTPDLVEHTRRAFESANQGDLDATMSTFARNAVLEATGLGTSFEGVAAIRGGFEDWIGAYEEFEIELEEIRDLGSGVVLAVIRQRARPAGSTAEVRMQHAWITVWVEGVIVRCTVYRHVHEGRAAAERLAEERE